MGTKMYGASTNLSVNGGAKIISDRLILCWPDSGCRGKDPCWSGMRLEAMRYHRVILL